MRKIILSLMLMLACSVQAANKQHTFMVGDKTFLLDGKPFVVKAAEVHYPRIPQAYWEHRIKMCKALGMNTLCLYVFWNIHEQQEGKFDFTGNNDVAAFCRLAQKNGMYVIVRPGPYVCAEWEMGGLPWWLLKKKDIRLREQDPYFMERVKVFEQKVGEQLASLTIQNGGPIIMIQVENEYGSYGEDKAYVSEIRDCLRSIYGEQTTLFQCDWASNFTKNGLDDLVWTMNFGTGANIDQQFSKLKQLRPNSPLMCSEFWSGWFDKWGARHETRPAEAMVQGIDEMLSKGISFSLYMTHGGTSFGHWAGANSPGFAPDVTSYDYDAPINEYGQPTEKYYLLRKTLEKYTDKKLPAVPKAPMPLIAVPEVKLSRALTLEQMIDRKVDSHNPQTFEDMNLGWGMAIYTTTLPQIADKSVLTISEPHDFVQVFVDETKIGTIDRVKHETSLMIPAVRKGQTLRLVVEAMGRINFGRAIKDYKGITKSVTLQTEQDGHELLYTLKDWKIGLIPDDYAHLAKQMAVAHEDFHTAFTNNSSKAGVYIGSFILKKVGDTFINLERWGKGQVYVNGHALGRFWSIGPQQSLYCPGCWLKKGKNEIVVFDLVGPKETTIRGQAQPELDKLQMEKSNKHNNPGNCPDLNSDTPALLGTASSGNGWQTFRFATPQKGRLICIQINGNQDGKLQTAIAELYALDAQGKRLSREPWIAHYADSENLNGNHTLDKVFDLQESTYWQTERNAEFPHLMVIDLGSEQTVTAVEYLPRAEEGAPGSMKDFKIFLK